MRFVAIKTDKQQAVLMLHRTRDLLVRQRTQLINAMRAHLAELGLVAALLGQLAALRQQLGKIERHIQAQHRSRDASRRLETIPGIGVIGATAIAASVPDAGVFKSGREFAAWIGLVPRQNSTGGKERLGSISKLGDRYLRRLLVVGATAVIRRARAHPEKHPWLIQLLARRPAKVVAVALANKTARIAWAVLAKGETYRAPALAASV
jgi:transposase